MKLHAAAWDFGATVTAHRADRGQRGGPLHIGWGQTYRGDSSFYLFLGRPMDHD